MDLVTEIETWPIRSIVPYDRNPRKISQSAIDKVARSIESFGFNVPIVVDEEGVILAGHTRREALLRLGADEAAVIVKTDLSDAQKRAYRIADNRVAEESEWDPEKLAAEIGDLSAEGFELDALGFDPEQLTEMLKALESGGGPGGTNGHAPAMGSLADRFGIPPFSVLNAREGWWQERKAAWIRLGIRSEVGRGENALGFSPGINGSMQGAGTYDQAKERARAGQIPSGLAFGEMHMNDGAQRTINGTSIFDPVLCELAYRWWCPPGGVILDPFSGGSVRGIVASRLGRAYHGVDLRAEQVAANEDQIAIAGKPAPVWYRGDSRELDRILPAGLLADFIWTCPPYADLEVYSDDPADLSRMDYASFAKAYTEIIAAAAARLKDNRFAAIVIGDARGSDGAYYGLPWLTVAAADAAGLRLYNEAVLVTAVGSLPILAAKQFETSRKLGKTHQNVLVFVKGDARLATQAIGACEFGSIEDAGEPGEAPDPEPE